MTTNVYRIIKSTIILYSLLFTDCVKMITNDSLKNQKSLPIILFMGASESSGFGLADQKTFVDMFSQLVENERPQKYIVVNASFPGASTSDLKELLNRTNVNKNTISHLVITLGLSDAIYQTPPTEIYNNLKEGINHLKEKQPNIKIWLMKCDIFQHHAINSLPLKSSPYYINFRKAFDDIGKEKQVQIFPFIMEDIINSPSLMLSDMIHPNEKGASKMAIKLYNYINDDL